MFILIIKKVICLILYIDLFDISHLINYCFSINTSNNDSINISTISFQVPMKIKICTTNVNGY